MNVRVVITRYRGIKYRIDEVFYENEMYIPEIIRDRKIETYGILDGVMIIRTKQHIKE